MKETKFYNNVSVFSVLIGTKKETSGYARNKDLVEAFQAKEYENKFPILFSSLNRKLHAAAEEQMLRIYIS